jgi:hypothetical protein
LIAAKLADRGGDAKAHKAGKAGVFPSRTPAGVEADRTRFMLEPEVLDMAVDAGRAAL